MEQRENSILFRVDASGTVRMVLVDTSVWILYLREGNLQMSHLLNEGKVACHPFVIGELACGNLKNRNEILSLLKLLPLTEIVEQDEILGFIENYKLMGGGIGFIDVHLLASAMLTNIPLWTFDKELNRLSARLKINYKV